jgi:hypothetical protein
MSFSLSQENKMKLFLDDERETPYGWERTCGVADAISLLKRNPVIISLDHDLGEGKGTGYDVLLWIEEQVFTNPTYVLPQIVIHTANPSARQKMLLAVERITSKYNESKYKVKPQENDE